MIVNSHSGLDVRPVISPSHILMCPSLHELDNPVNICRNVWNFECVIVEKVVVEFAKQAVDDRFASYSYLLNEFRLKHPCRFDDLVTHLVIQFPKFNQIRNKEGKIAVLFRDTKSKMRFLKIYTIIRYKHLLYLIKSWFLKGYKLEELGLQINPVSGELLL